MGVGRSFGEAFYKSLLGAGEDLPSQGVAFISVRDADKAGCVEVARSLHRKGFKLLATDNTARVIRNADTPCEQVNKVMQGRPHIVDMIINDEIDLIINTTEGKQAIRDSFTIRREAMNHKVPLITTLSGARATCMALDYLENTEVNKLQDLHAEVSS
jgi:carbamoyl-phosphate synthase large subunit